MKHALRSWLRTPRLALTLLACIAISIGGTATVLTFVHAILLRPLPFPHAERLVTIVPADLGADARPHLNSRPYLSYPNFADLRAAATTFELLEGATVSRLIMQIDGWGGTAARRNGHARLLRLVRRASGARARVHRRGVRGHGRPRDHPLETALENALRLRSIGHRSRGADACRTCGRGRRSCRRIISASARAKGRITGSRRSKTTSRRS